MDKAVSIVGANAAGVSAALSLREAGFEGPIRLVDGDVNALCERPPLSKEALLTGAQPSKLVSRESLESLDIDCEFGLRCTAIAARRLELAGGASFSHDHLIIASGAAALLPNVPGATDPACISLRTWDDARALRAGLMGSARVAIIGGGVIGCEVASVAVAMGKTVTIIEASPVLMGRSFGVRVGGLLTRRVDAAGVAVLTGRAPTQIVRRGGELRVHLNDGKAIDVDLVVMGVGTAPNDALAHNAGIETDRGVMIDADGRTNAENVFAAGDVASIDWRGRRLRCEQQVTAQTQGARAAAALLGVKSGPSPSPYFWSEQWGVSIQAMGAPGLLEAPIVRGHPDTGDFTAFFLEHDCLISVVSVGRTREFMTAKRLVSAEAAMDAHRLADAAVPLEEAVLGGRPRARAAGLQS